MQAALFANGRVVCGLSHGHAAFGLTEEEKDKFGDYRFNPLEVYNPYISQIVNKHGKLINISSK